MNIIVIKIDVKTSKDKVSIDTTSAKITRTSSKNAVQKRHLSLYGPPYASKKGFIYIDNFWQQHIYFERGPLV